MAALKLTSLHLDNSSWCLANFGNVLYKDTSTRQAHQDTVELLSGKYHLRRPPRHGCHGLTSIAATVFTVRGLREFVEALLHPSVWNADGIDHFLRHTENLYRPNSGKIDLPKVGPFFHGALPRSLPERERSNHYRNIQAAEIR